MRGGLGLVAAVSCAAVGAISGSGIKGIAAIGPLLIPEMDSRGYASFRDVIKTYIPGNTHFEVWYMIISNGSLGELSDEDQAALKEQTEAFETARWDVAETDQGKNEQRLVDELGATVAALSADDLAGMAAKVRADVWPAVLEDVGVDWDQVILDKVAEAGN